MLNFIRLCQREGLLATRQLSDSVQALLLYLLLLSLFAFILQGHPTARLLTAPTFIWFSVIVATSLTADRLFRDDYYDGSLEHFVLSDQPLMSLVAAKCLVYWMVTVLPIIVTLPIVGPLLMIDAPMTQGLFLGLLFGTPILVLLLALAAVVTLPLAQRGVLINLLIWPLILPVVLLALGLLNTDVDLVVFLVALLTLAVTLLPWMIRYCLLISLE